MTESGAPLAAVESDRRIEADQSRGMQAWRVILEKRPGQSRIAALIALAILPFLPAVSGEYIRDDGPYVVENPDVVLDRSPLEIFRHTYPPHGPHGLYRPLTTLTYRFDQWTGGGRPLSFKITNLLLHAGCVGAAFALLRRLGVPGPGAFAAAALFAVHPTHAEAVCEITGRSETLAFGLGVAALLVAAAPTWSVRRFALVSGLSFAAALAKENGIVFAALVPVVLTTLPERPSGRLRRSLAAIFGAALAVLTKWIVTGSVILEPGVRVLGSRGFMDRSAIGLKLVGVDYPLMSFWPNAMRHEYPDIHAPTSSAVWLVVAGAVVAGLATLAWRARHTAPLATSAALWFGLSLAPFLHVLTPIGETAAQRFFFTPSFAAALGLAAAWRHVEGNKRRRQAFGALLLVVSGFTAWRSSDFGNEERLWRRESARHADAPRAAFAGALVASRGLQAAAATRLQAAALDRALVAHPRHPESLMRRALTGLAENDRKTAAECLDRLAQSHPRWLGLASVRGRIAKSLGQEHEARAHFETARRDSAHDPVCRIELARAALFVNDWDAAEVLLREAVRAALLAANATWLPTAFEGLAAVVRAGTLEPRAFRREIEAASRWILPHTVDARGRRVRDVLATLRGEFP